MQQMWHHHLHHQAMKFYRYWGVSKHEFGFDQESTVPLIKGPLCQQIFSWEIGNLSKGKKNTGFIWNSDLHHTKACKTGIIWVYIWMWSTQYIIKHNTVFTPHILTEMIQNIQTMTWAKVKTQIRLLRSSLIRVSSVCPETYKILLPCRLLREDGQGTGKVSEYFW